MANITLRVNGRSRTVDVEAATLRFVAEEALGHGAAADVTGADEQDLHGEW